MLLIAAIVGIALVRMKEREITADDIDISAIPNPFSQHTTTAATVTDIGMKGLLHVKKITFNEHEAQETALSNTIYLMVTPPKERGFYSEEGTFPIDVAVALALEGKNIFGYEYTSLSAAIEKQKAGDPVFANRFPGKFFATQKARDEDPLHGNDLANFESQNSILFLPTNPRKSNSVLLKSSKLYVIVANENSPVTINLAPVQVCGNAWVQTGEQCDDGNAASGDGCSSLCTVETGYACMGNPSSCSSIKTPKKCASIPTIIQPSGDFAINNDDPAGYRETGIWQTLAQGYKSTEREFDAFSPEVPSALWCADDLPDVETYEVYATWKPSEDRSGKVVYEILNQTAVLSTIEANQSSEPADLLYDGVMWKRLSTLQFKPGRVQVNITAPVGTAALADAVLFRKKPPAPLQLCGNGVREGTEQCDDGNTNDTDECRNDCSITTPLPF